MLSGRWASTKNSCLLLPAACKHTSCLRSAQSMPTKAAYSRSVAVFIVHLLSAKVGGMDMRVWTGGEGSIGSQRRASPEYSLSPGAPADSKLGWRTLQCSAL